VEGLTGYGLRLIAAAPTTLFGAYTLSRLSLVSVTQTRENLRTAEASDQEGADAVFRANAALP
jgi:hypothetical protein